MKEIIAPMAGNVWKVVVTEGEKVHDGEDIIILESMKMEIPIRSEYTGTVKELKVAAGDFVNEGDVIAMID